MREIKFRVYSEINMVMYTPEMDKQIGDLWAIPKAQGGLLNYPNGILMQSTGLKDKNGKEIYEGDIVSWLFEGKYVSYKVEFISGMFALHINGYSYPLDEYIGQVEFKIIGNIYENPEILEQK